MVETTQQPEDEVLSLDKTAIPVHETVFHYHAMGKPFENAFKQYINLDPDDLKKLIDSLPDETKKGDPNFLGLKFEDLFNIPVEVARSDINTVTQQRREGNVESLERTIDINANINEDDFSILGVNTLRDYFINLNNSTLAPFPPASIELPPPVNTTHGTPTTPSITFDSAFTGGKNTEVLLNTQNSVTLQGNIFNFGAGGGSIVNAFFAPPARGGSVEDRSVTGEVIFTTPEGNTLTFYTGNVNGHVTGDIVYILHHSILTPPEPFVIISGQKVHKDLFQYSVTDSFSDTNVGSLEIQIIDDMPVATNQNAPSAISESNIQNIGSNKLGTVDTLIGSLIVPSIQASPPGPGDLSDNRFGANGGSVTSVTVAGGSTVPNGFGYTVTDVFGNTLFVNRTTGSYIYTLNVPFHNTNNQPFNEQFTYQFTDNEGQTASAVLTVVINDDTPVAVNLGNSISEANILNIGLNESNTIATATGLLVPASPTTSTSRYGADGPASGGGITNATLTSESGTSGVTATTTFGTITNTQIANSNGAFTNANLGHASIVVTDSLSNTLVIDRVTSRYVYTLNAAFTDASNNPAVLTYTYQLTDSDGSTASANLVITVADDAPHAVNLSNSISETNIKTIGSNDSNNFATIAGLLVPVSPTTSTSRYGADGPSLGGGITNVTLSSESGTSGVTATTTFGTITNTQITNSNGAFTNANLGHASIVVTDSLGNTLVIDRITNAYVYTLNAPFTDASNNPAVLTYTYQLTDSDGSTSSANLVITVADDAPHAVNLSNSISETNIKTIGSNDSNNFATITGLLVAVAPTTSDSRYGADGPASGGGITNATLTSESGTSGVTATTTFGTITNTQITNSNGAFTNANLGHASIVVTDSLGNTLVIDRITNQYVYTLNAAFTDASNNPAVLTYTYQLTDSDGSTSSANLVITVADDAPQAVNLSNSISETNIKTIGSNDSNNFATITGLLVAVSPTTSDSRYGADGPASGGGITNATLTSESGTSGVTATTTFGTITNTQITNSNGAFTNANLGHASIVVTDSLGNTLVIDRITNAYVYTLNAAFTDASNNPAILTFTYQLTDSDGSTSSANLVITVADDAPQAVNLSNSISETNIKTIGSNDSNNFATITGLLVAVSPTTSDSRYGADGPASGGGITNATLTSESGTSGVTATTTFGTITNTQITNSNGAFTNANLGHASIVVTDSLGNTLVIDRITNAYVYTLNAAFTDASNNPAVLTYTYQLTDSDGSTSSANLVITVADDAPQAVNLSNSISEANILNIGSNGAITIATVTGLLVPASPTTSTSRYGADGPASGGGVTNATLSSESGTSGVTATTTFGTITNTQITNSNGAFTNANLGHASIVVTDSLGNTLVIDRITNAYVYTLNAPFTDASNNPAVLTYTYQLTDSDGSTSSANLVITVADDIPIANAKSNTANETLLFVNGTNTASGNIITDNNGFGVSVFGADGGTLSKVNNTTAVAGIITASTTYGSIQVYTTAQSGHQPGDYIYSLDSTKTTPVSDALGQVVDTISYQLTDGDGSTGSSNLSITVTLNQPPTANNDSGTTDQATTLSVVVASGVLVNDTVSAGDTKIVSAVNGVAGHVGNQFALASGALLTLNSNGSYSYIPNGNFFGGGSDSFTYTMTEAEGLTSSATVNITITAPQAVNDSGSVNESSILTMNAISGLLSNDVKSPVDSTIVVHAVNGSTAHVGVQFSLPSGALLKVSANGSYTYNPNVQFECGGSDSFTYQIADGHNGLSNVATVSITINGNGNPVAADDSGSTHAGTPLVVGSLSGLLANDTPNDADSSISVASVNGVAGNVGNQFTLPSGALLTVNSDGSYTYDDNGHFASTGTDNFTYTASTPCGTSNTATVTITVQVPPIILDLNDNGIELIALENSKVAWSFPCGNNHFIGWVGPEDGILVYDYDGDGKITKIDEFSFVSYHPDAKTDLDGLRLAFDSNHDGVFDINDEHFSQFAVWQDSNSNGITDPGELISLIDRGITSIDLTATPQNQNIDGNIIYGTTTYQTSDGQTHLAADVGLKVGHVLSVNDVLIVKSEIDFSSLGENAKSELPANSAPAPQVVLETAPMMDMSFLLHVEQQPVLI